MNRRVPITSLQRISDINLTPLMDLTFILLITFIITFPLIEQGIAVDLPRGKAADLDEPRAQTVTVDREGTVYLDDAAVSLEELGERVAVLRRAAPDLTVMVRADEALRYGSLVRVMKRLHDARVSRIALITRADEEAR